jgi:hypothetical protein
MPPYFLSILFHYMCYYIRPGSLNFQPPLRDPDTRGDEPRTSYETSKKRCAANIFVVYTISRLFYVCPYAAMTHT